MQQIKTDELDFDLIKSNIKVFLSGQAEFTDYDFEGSVMSTLLDILAYNTHYNLLYTNLAINESFIDSASKRSSVVSIAKSLGYTAKSMRSSRAVIDIVVTLPNTDVSVTQTIPKNTIFSSIANDVPLQFMTASDISANRLNGVFTFSGIEVVQGTQNNISYVAAEGSKFVIPAKDVDLTTLTVTVFDSVNSSNFTTYTNISDILKVTGVVTAYFIKQRDDLFYEVSFGNDSIGKAVVSGNVVKLDYIISGGTIGNSASLFTYQSGYNSSAGFTITTTNQSNGGSLAEDIDSIRFNAPRSFISQNRAVTVSDYENLLSSTFSNIESVRCWGGQDNIPPVYGKVFISAKPVGRTAFSAPEKQSISQNLLTKRGMITVTPQFIDPEYLNIQITSVVNYNANLTNLNPASIVTSVKNSIVSYGNTLNKFDSVFRFSKLSTIIDNTDSSITSNATSIKVRFPVKVSFNIGIEYKKILDNPILPGTFLSTRFFISSITDRCFLSDDGLGVIRLFSEDVLGTSTYVSDIGTINYGNGSWNIPVLNVQTLHDPQLEFVFQPSSNDVVSTRNLIVAVSVETLSVNVFADLIAMGESSGGSNYKFTTVR